MALKQQISEDKIRTIKALFDIGAQHAKREIEDQLVRSKVLLKVPQVAIIYLQSLRKLEEEHGTTYACASSGFHGDLIGQGAILIKSKPAWDLATVLSSNPDGPARPLDPKQLAASISKLGEIMLQNVMAVVSRALHAQTHYESVQFQTCTSCDGGLSGGGNADSILVACEMHYAIASRGTSGEILLLVRLDTMPWLLAHLPAA